MQEFEDIHSIPPLFTGKCKIKKVSLIAYYLDGQLHRLDGPALEWLDGTKRWKKAGKLHCLSGPAEEYADGSRYWWVEGNEYSEEDFNVLPEVIMYKAGLGIFI